MTEPHDDELLARLRGADPASSLPPVAPERAAQLLEDTMSQDLLTQNREDETRGRGPLTWLVAAAAVVLIAAGGAFAVLSGDDTVDPVPSADPPASVTQLNGPGAAAYDSRCMVPNARVLATKTVAFDGVVEGIEGDSVTLVPSHWYAGTRTDQVVVQAPGTELESLLSAVMFEEGGRYLVAADDSGTVMICGFSAPYSAELAAVYDEAFPT